MFVFNLGHKFLLFPTFFSLVTFSPKGDFISFKEIEVNALHRQRVTSCSASKLIFHLMKKYQLHQHKGVGYGQVAKHPMTACLGGEVF